MRAFGRLHHVFAILLATLTGLVASLAFGMPAHAAYSGGISGTVTDTHGDPVQGVSVRAALVGSDVYGGFVSTDAEGRYQLTGMPSGSFHVGFATNYGGQLKVVHYLNAATRAAATPVTVTDGELTTGIDQTLDTGASIAGVVTGPTGQPLKGISVMAYASPYPGAGWMTVTSTTSNDAGGYTLAGLQAQTYRIGFTDPTGVHAPEFFDNAASVESAQNIVVAADSRIVGKDAGLSTASHITGKVTGPGGASLQGIYVQAWRKVEGQEFWNTSGASTTTRADGTYDLGGLRPGTYRIGFSGGYQSAYVSEFWDDAATVGSAKDIVVDASATVAGKDAELATASHITGKVTGPDGAGLGSISVQAYRYVPAQSSWTWAASASTDAEGSYDVAGLAAGTYRIEFSPYQGGYISEYWDDAATMASARDIEVRASETVSGKDAQLSAGSHVTGKVTAPGGTPLQGIYVQAWQKVAGQEYWNTVGMSATTGADGTYDLAGLRAGTYRIGFSSGYQSAYLSEFWDDAATVDSAKDVVVDASATVAGKDAELATASHITGRVTGPGGAALASVSVQAYQKSPTSSYWNQVGMPVQTMGDGTYDLGGLRTGSYRIGFATNQGSYLAEYWDNAGTVDAATTIMVGESATVSGKDAELVTASHITGKVTGADGAAMGNVSVQAYQKSPTSPFWTHVGMPVQTMGDGTYDLGGLRAGTYRIGFRTYQGTYLAEYWDNADTVDTATDIMVGDSATVSGKDAELATASHITGTVTGPDGAGLANVMVQAYEKSDDSDFWDVVGMSAQTRNDGTYDLGGLEKGTYRIGFRTFQGGHLSEYWNDAASVSSATDIVVGESATVTGKDAQLASASHITGTVTGPDGTGLANVMVQAHRKSPDGTYWSELPLSASTRPDGTYDLGGLAAGTYRLEFYDYQGGHVGEFWNDAATIESATDIVVAESATVTGKDAQLARGAHVTGKVTGPTGAGVADVQVTLYQKTSEEEGWSSTAWASTKPDGTYDLGGLRAGTYRIGFRPYWQGLVAEYWDNALTLSSARDIVVRDGETVAGKDAQLADGAHITGTVTGPDGSAVADAQVAAYAWSEVADTWESVAWASTTQDGSYDVRGLAAGTYRIEFISSDEYAVEYWDDATSVETATDIVVGESATVTGKNAQLSAAAHITGTVTATSSTSDVWVTAYRQVGPEWVPVWGTYAGSEGAYDIGGLAEGTYRIGFEDEAGKLASEYWNDKAEIALADDITVGVAATVTGKDASLVERSTPAYVSAQAPTVTGTAQVGATLTASPGTWSPSGASFAYQWLADDVDIAGATSSTLTLTAGLEGKRIRVRVTAWGSGASNGIATSAATEPVAAVPTTPPTTTPPPTTPPPTTSPTTPPPTTSTPTPVPDVASQLADVAEDLTVKGKPVVGKTVSVKNLVAQLRTSVTYKFQWYAGSKKIRKATRSSLKITSPLKGKKLKVKVTLVASGTQKVVTLNLGKVR